MVKATTARSRPAILRTVGAYVAADLVLSGRLGWWELRRRRTTTALAAAGGVGAALLLAAPSTASRGGVSLDLAAVILMVSVPATLAAGTHPDQRREAALLSRLGCGRLVQRLAVTLAVTAAVTVPAWLTTVAASALTEADPNRADTAVFLVAALPFLGAWLTSGARLPDLVPDRRRPRARTRLQGAIGLVLVVLGCLAPGAVTSGSSLELGLPIALILAFAGLFVLSPLLVAGLGRVAARQSGTAVRLAGAAVRDASRALTVPVAVTAAAACLLVVQSMVGAGLHQREQARVAAIEALGPTTAGTSARVVVAGGNLGRAWEADADVGPATAEHPGKDVASSARAAAPAARVAEIRRLAYQPRSGRAVYGDITRSDGDDWPLDRAARVAVATPELLAALDIDPTLATSRWALVLDRRTLRGDGTVRLAEIPADISAQMGADESGWPVRTLPARTLETGGVPTALPAVLVPRTLVPPGIRSNVAGAVVAFDRRPRETQVVAVASATGLATVRGDQPVDLAATNRTDDTGAVWIRSSGDVVGLVATLGTATVAALVLAQLVMALTHRRDDDLLAVLGARRSALTAVAAVRGVLVALVATAVGASVGIGGTLIGLARYRSTGRFAEVDALLPVPTRWPIPMVVGLVALPLVAGAIGAALARWRPQADPTTRAERLAW